MSLRVHVVVQQVLLKRLHLSARPNTKVRCIIFILRVLAFHYDISMEKAQRLNSLYYSDVLENWIHFYKAILTRMNCPKWKLETVFSHGSHVREKLLKIITNSTSNLLEEFQGGINFEKILRQKRLYSWEHSQSLYNVKLTPLFRSNIGRYRPTCLPK